MCVDSRLKVVGDVNIVTRWDHLFVRLASHFEFVFTAHRLLLDTKFNAAQTRILSLQRLLEKLFTLHRHIRTITRIACLADSLSSSRENSRWFLYQQITMIYPSNSLGKTSSLSYFLQETRRRRTSRAESTMGYWSG